ncbi:uncharacterized protein LOC117169316 isoform X2 [Belonocnema kinseyi]|uniref:uncharacterized protein LOC117169316 isoform X2 n=1 Tax=Belonocnema kinseyi TaxID=2817044 RepID=UPI00143D8402|nr:uncharacterized protein LOC117169316 isoform X2 [Belonocnema kinseyi]
MKQLLDLIGSSGEVPVPPRHILLEVYFCEVRPDTVTRLGGHVKAVLDENRQYIIGVKQFRRLCPLLIQPEPMEFKHVKVRLDGGPVANVTEEIPEGDPLKNKFWKKPKQLPLINAEIPIL